MHMARAGAITREPFELPTIMLFVGSYLVFGLLTWFWAALPWGVLAAAGGYVVALHGSMQHEALHGHPTRYRWVNELLVFPSLGLWYPYRRYARLHRQHHRNEMLTDPREDPESWYMLPECWASMNPLLRTLYLFNNTALGRLTIGPLITVVRFAHDEIARARGGERDIGTAWLLHAVGIGILLVWVMAICGMPLWRYILLFAYPGLSLGLLRSFCEHQAHERVEARTAVIETGPVMSLLYLNNNLHAAHHEHPGLAWYRLPAYYRARRQALLAGNDGYVLNGYREILRRYLLTAKESVPHPLAGR
jgi:fatty acid desaturase